METILELFGIMEMWLQESGIVGWKTLIACMAYVDLNPIRAKMAETPEQSRYTSVKRRIEAWQSQGERAIR